MRSNIFLHTCTNKCSFKIICPSSISIIFFFITLSYLYFVLCYITILIWQSNISFNDFPECYIDKNSQKLTIKRLIQSTVLTVRIMKDSILHVLLVFTKCLCCCFCRILLLENLFWILYFTSMRNHSFIGQGSVVVLNIW